MILDFAIVVSQSQSLHKMEKSTVCVFSSSEFFSSFLNVETSFKTPSSPQFELYGTRLFLQKRHIPFGTRCATAWRTVVPEMMLHQGDLF